MTPNNLPILYSFRRCPYAMRARMALTVGGIKWDHREILLRDKPAAMLDASPKGTVPVLVLPDGQVLEESLDIIYWALHQNDPENWLDGDDRELIAENDGPFKTALDQYKYANRHAISDNRIPRDTGMLYLQKLNDRLMDRKYLCGSHRTMADMAIFTFVRQFAATDQDWFDAQAIPALQAWLARLVSSTLFVETMAKYPVWQPE